MRGKVIEIFNPEGERKHHVMNLTASVLEANTRTPQ
jgi:hypothetical protein